MATTPFGLATATVTQDGSPPKLGNPTSHDVHPLPWCEPSEPPGAPPGTPQGGYSPNVFVNGKPVHRQGDRFVPHTIPIIPPPPPHPDIMGVGSNARVFFNGKIAATLGTPTVQGGLIVVGSHSVFM